MSIFTAYAEPLNHSDHFCFFARGDQSVSKKGDHLAHQG